MKIWTWNESNEAWLEVGVGNDQTVVERYARARQHEIWGAAFIALPAGQKPKASPDVLGLETTRAPKQDDSRPLCMHSRMSAHMMSGNFPMLCGTLLNDDGTCPNSHLHRLELTFRKDSGKPALSVMALADKMASAEEEAARPLNEAQRLNEIADDMERALALTEELHESLQDSAYSPAWAANLAEACRLVRKASSITYRMAQDMPGLLAEAETLDKIRELVKE
jgi:hypothetical protein